MKKNISNLTFQESTEIAKILNYTTKDFDSGLLDTKELEKRLEGSRVEVKEYLISKEYDFN